MAERPLSASDNVKILVVDDRQDRLLAFQSILEDLGETVVAARSGRDALKLVLEQEFAVILLDVNMPDMDGFETAGLIRKRRKSAHTPIIFVTAYADEMQTIKGYALGAVDYILSPVVPEILQTKVRVLVELYRMTRKAREQAEERVALAKEQAARAAAEDATRRSNYLAEASTALAHSLDFESTVRAVARVAIPSLGDLSALMLLDEAGRVERTELVWHAAGESRSRSFETMPELPFTSAIQRVLASRRPEVLAELSYESATPLDGALSEWGEAARVHAAALFPLLARGRMLGVLGLGLGASARVFDDAALALAGDVADRAAIALDNALLYQKLQETDRRKNEFLAILAHELRNPLAPIRNALEVLNTAGADAPKIDWARAVIDRQLNQLIRLVDDLLDVSRITRGMIQLKLAPIDASTVISTAVETSMPLIESRRHRLTVSLPKEPLQIKVDHTRVAQIISNLLNNAAKYTPEGGRISLTVRRDGNEAIFSVADNGIGLTPDMLSRVFDLFSQAHSSSESSQGGLGIGLTLVRTLVNIHGGTVSASSAGINQGSEFIVRLPALRAPAAEAREVKEVAGAPAATPCRLRVLVVDDNRDVAESTAMVLRLAGCDVEIADDGPTALRVAGAFRPDAVLLDLGLPGMDGYEVARRLRELPNAPNMALVAASGYGQEEDLQRSREAGFDRHLVKPIDGAAVPGLLAALRASRPAAESIAAPEALAQSPPAAALTTR